MLNLLVLAICILSGLSLRLLGIVKKEHSIPLNQVIIYFFIPVLTLKYLPEIEFEPSYWWLILCPWIIYAGSFIFFRMVQGPLNVDRKTTGTLIMTAGIGSTSFVGFPIFELFYGDEGLILGIIMSLAGTFVVFNTAGIFTGFWYGHKKPSLKQVLYRMFRFVPFIAFLISIVLNIIGYRHPDMVKQVLNVLAEPFTVVVLITIGIQLEVLIKREELRYLLMGQLYKLILAPILIYLVLSIFAGEMDLVSKICILGAAIGSHNAMSIIAVQLGLNEKLAIQMPSLSIPFSILWLLLIGYLFL